MKLGRIALVAMLAVVSFMGLSVVSATAQAHPNPPPSSCIGFENTWGVACFEFNGDDQWVFDKVGNGWGIVAQVETDYGKIRWCADPHTAGSWHECNYDHREESCVRFRFFEQFGSDNTQTRNWTSWSPWIHAGTGSLTACT